MTQNYLIGGSVCAVLAVLAFWGMWRSWNRRQRQGDTLVAALPPVTGAAQQKFERVLYVVTHPAAQPLVRVSLPGLIYRGYATVTVQSDGLKVAIPGENETAIGAIHRITTCQSSLAKTVEKDGLVEVHWRAGEQALVSVFRLPSAAQQKEFINLVTSNIEGTGQC
ncbi:hypothetical protein EII31_01905 [Leucobacter sp. OH2974_COT-288]|nr:hypothetical protein EII31_01905 [Leucobacter sp. OH2974_COT-288]